MSMDIKRGLAMIKNKEELEEYVELLKHRIMELENNQKNVVDN